MTKIKTADLIGPALDRTVAKCEGEDYRPVTTYSGIGHEFPPTNYSTDWSQGGPIIEREGICVFIRSPHWPENNRWSARQEDGASLGPTALIAAMRCFVSSKMGAEVEVPAELIGD